MTLQNVEIRYKIYDKDGQEAHPFIPDLLYESAIVTPWNQISISANAANETVNIGDFGTVKILHLKVNDPADVGKITVKLNGSGTGYTLSPRQIFSETFSGLTASNSSSSAVNILYKVVYES